VIFEGIVAIIAGVIELIAGFFTAGAEAMSAGEAIIVLFLFIIELIIWVFLILRELLISLIKRRKPRKVKKPIIWRKKRIQKDEIEKTLNG